MLRDTLAEANVLASAVAGAQLGRAVLGVNGRQTGQVAGWNAVNGGVQGLAWGSVEWQAKVNRCMAGRGQRAELQDDTCALPCCTCLGRRLRRGHSRDSPPLPTAKHGNTRPHEN